MSKLSESDLVKSRNVTLVDGSYVYQAGTDNEFVYKGKPITNKTSCKRHGVALTCSMWRNLDLIARKVGDYPIEEDRRRWAPMDHPKLWVLDRRETRTYERTGYSGVKTTSEYEVRVYRPVPELEALLRDWPYWHRAEMRLDNEQIDPEEIVGETIAPPRIPEMEGAAEHPKLTLEVSDSCDSTPIKLTKGQLNCLIAIVKTCNKNQGVAYYDHFNRVALRALIRKKLVVTSAEIDETGNPLFGILPTQDAAMHAMLHGALDA